MTANTKIEQYKVAREMAEQLRPEVGQAILKAVAGIVGVDPEAVKEHNMKPKNMAVRVITAGEMKEAGYTVEEIGQAVNRTKSMMSRLIRDIPNRAERDEQFAEWLEISRDEVRPMIKELKKT